MKARPHDNEKHNGIMEKMLSMSLHDEERIDGQLVIRVPGGWIYKDYSDNHSGEIREMCFVPIPKALRD